MTSAESNSVTLHVRQVPYPPRPDEFPILTPEMVADWVGHSVVAHLGFDSWQPYVRLIVRAVEVDGEDVTLTCAVYGHAPGYDRDRFDGSDVALAGKRYGRDEFMVTDLAPVWSLNLDDTDG